MCLKFAMASEVRIARLYSLSDLTPESILSVLEPLALRRLGLNRPHPNCLESPPSQSLPSTTNVMILGPPSTTAAT